MHDRTLLLLYMLKVSYSDVTLEIFFARARIFIVYL